MNNEEQHERACEILSNILDRVPTSSELLDLSSMLGIKFEDWYYPKGYNDENKR
jgi:hypothetical protein